MRARDVNRRVELLLVFQGQGGYVLYPCDGCCKALGDVDQGGEHCNITG